MQDPFDYLDESRELSALVNEIGIGPTCSAEEYATGDDNLQICAEAAGDDWDDQFLAGLSHSQHTKEIDPEFLKNYVLRRWSGYRLARLI